MKGRDKWRTYDRIVRGKSRVEGGLSREKKMKAKVGIDGFSEQNVR